MTRGSQSGTLFCSAGKNKWSETYMIGFSKTYQTSTPVRLELPVLSTSQSSFWTNCIRSEKVLYMTRYIFNGLCKRFREHVLSIFLCFSPKFLPSQGAFLFLGVIWIHHPPTSQTRNGCLRTQNSVFFNTFGSAVVCVPPSPCNVSMWLQCAGLVSPLAPSPSQCGSPATDIGGALHPRCLFGVDIVNPNVSVVNALSAYRSLLCVIDINFQFWFLCNSAFTLSGTENILCMCMFCVYHNIWHVYIILCMCIFCVYCMPYLYI